MLNITKYIGNRKGIPGLEGRLDTMSASTPKQSLRSTLTIVNDTIPEIFAITGFTDVLNVA